MPSSAVLTFSLPAEIGCFVVVCGRGTLLHKHARNTCGRASSCKYECDAPDKYVHTPAQGLQSMLLQSAMHERATAIGCFGWFGWLSIDRVPFFCTLCTVQH